MIKYYLSVFFALWCTISVGQDIYGNTALPSHGLRCYSMHNGGDNPIIPSVLFTQDGSSLGNETTSDLDNDIYYFLGRPGTLFMDSNVVHIVDVVNKTHVIDTFGGDSIRHIQYHNDTLWGLYENGISFYDIKTGKLFIYDSLVDGREKGKEFFHWVFNTAFDHENKIYMFTKRGEWTGVLPDTFCYYNINNKVLVKRIIPGGFLFFDYSPADKTVYMPYNGLRASDRMIDSVSGLYKYDPYSNALKMHIKVDTKEWQGAKQFWSLTIDPYRNRMFFILAGTGGPRDTLGMLRINNGKFEKFSLTKSRYWDRIEFLNTYNDNTVDTPLSINCCCILQEELIFYPNPASDKLFIESNNVVLQNVEIFDISGRMLIKESILPKKSKKTELNLTDIRTGLYMLKVTSDKDVQIRTFNIFK